jgi:hypothetical protein
MSTILPENATSWRELGDQLTPEQIVEIEESEDAYRHQARLPKPWWSTARRSTAEITALMLVRAREHTADNLHDVLFAGVALPPRRPHPRPGSQAATASSTARPGPSPTTSSGCRQPRSSWLTAASTMAPPSRHLPSTWSTSMRATCSTAIRLASWPRCSWRPRTRSTGGRPDDRGRVIFEEMPPVRCRAWHTLPQQRRP